MKLRGNYLAALNRFSPRDDGYSERARILFYLVRCTTRLWDGDLLHRLHALYIHKAISRGVQDNLLRIDDLAMENGASLKRSKYSFVSKP